MSGELTHDAHEHELTEDPVCGPPANDPPIIKRPPKNEPKEPAELPRQDPSPRRPNRSHPRDGADVAERSDITLDVF